MIDTENEASFIDVTNLESGVYFLKIISENNMVSKKIIKN
jgi:hypothetical protein